MPRDSWVRQASLTESSQADITRTAMDSVASQRTKMGDEESDAPSPWQADRERGCGYVMEVASF